MWDVSMLDLMRVNDQSMKIYVKHTGLLLWGV